ncbi:uncharacterized protein BO96DRAFT_436161 [Aspergillus niger CBS 101883]|uniref:uncharacterized protein n=1 Tax=Aspergillus lacticoffeatus (strain CBS 101883) TaxID=1450533 RepID=UPI000D7FB8B3|nr:uncharacterized protein BO96DRAFT_436161 [Aspergillus niger CBS 101883]PYH54542.1 hypothetical protein BO96DRAFT_436161 [Aspergillus niger CBS 101883]
MRPIKPLAHTRIKRASLGKFLIVSLPFLSTLASAFIPADPEDSVETATPTPFGQSLIAGMTGYCQKAVDTMLPGLTNLTCSSSGRTGNCWGAPDGLGCGVFVAGPRGCTRTTEQMKAAFNNIRAHDCKICGTVTDDDNGKDNCQIKIDYVTGCNNHN